MNSVPVITLWQPYASLVFAPFDGAYAKMHETRGWQPPLKYVGGFVGIHAAAKFPAAKHISEELHELCMDIWGCSYNHTLPLGSVLGIVRLSGALPTETASPNSEADRVAGDWSPGRFAWPLCDVMPLSFPIPAKGKQGWWKFNMPSSDPSAVSA